MNTKQRLVLSLFILVALLAVVPAVVFAQDDGEGEPVTLRLAWWGNEDRHNMYNELADMYEEMNPNVTIEREFGDWGPYWERLATQVAGGNAPDVLHQHPTNVAEYATRGALLDLTPLVDEGMIDLSNFPEGIVDSGRVDGQIYMITLGNSSPALHYNTALIEEAGVEFDPFEWTWDEFVETAKTLSEELGEDAYGVGDAGGSDQIFEIFVNQRGKTLFTEDGQLGFDEEDIRAWWSIWEDLRETGAIPPAEILAEIPAGISSPESPLIQEIIAMDFVSGNQHSILQRYTETELGIAVIPRTEDGPPGDIIGGAYLSLSSDLEDNEAAVEEAAAFIDWFINDPDVAVIYGAEHGPPGSTEMVEAVRPTLGEADQRVLDYMAVVGPTASLRAQRPVGGSEAMDAFARAYEELAFGNMSIDDAIQFFLDEAEFILIQN